MTTTTVPHAGAPMLASPGEVPPRDAAKGANPFKRLFTQGRRSGWLKALVVVGLLLAAAMTVTVLTSGRTGNTNDLDPANPGYTGAQGLAHVLRDHGFSVTVVRTQRELLDQKIDGDTTLVITPTDHLSGRTAGAALAHAGNAVGVVLLDPDPEVTNGMGLPVESHLTDLTEVSARCQDSLVGKDFQLGRAGRAYTPTASGSGATICFAENSAGGGKGAVADRSNGGGAMVTLPAALGRPPVTLLGDDSLITNGAILDSDNAAIALHLFGQTNRLIWYVPSLADIAAADGTTRSIAPSWFVPGVVLSSSAVLFLCLWRGRRLGRLVTEPLPVIVRAVETTESRGRMYRKARDRTRALTVLQLATQRRVAAYLGLPASSAVSSVAAAAATVSGRNYQDVLSLLSSPAAHDDSSLLERANTLAALEKEVRRT